MPRFLPLLCLLVLAPVAVPSSQVPEHKPLANAVILIIRHAEKPDDGEGLTPIGEKRALAYIEYFKKYKINGKPMNFSHIFAASDSSKSHRPRLTIEPLAKALNDKIDLRFTDKDPGEIAQDLSTHDYGNQILISWRHGKIPGLLKALGADPAKLVPEGKWPENIYDRVLELHYNAQGQIIPQQCFLVLEHLMPGDEK